MDTATYLRLLTYARRRARVADEAEDLLQYALMAAIEAQRADMTLAENRRWLVGVLRNRARHEARSAIRRRRREAAYADSAPVDTSAVAEGPGPFLAALPPALRTTALLAFTGHTRAEIAWLLRLSDPALRQRLSQIRRRWRKAAPLAAPDVGFPRGDLAFGLLRRALIRRVHAPGVALASHDPDGHLFVLTSRSSAPRQPGVCDI